jgi:phenylacetate-CoA ligase
MNEPDALARQLIANIGSKKSLFWEKERELHVLGLFHRAARGVPAYKDFLKKHGINPQKIRDYDDFKSVPPTSKANYLKQYPPEKLTWGGTYRKQLAWTSTSGSTDEPFYFPRGPELDWESSITHEIFLRNSSHGTDGPTLVIIGFGMGVWIGGLITYKAFEIAARRGYNLSIITPGINKAEIFSALKNLAPHFKQVIFVAYPPFMKDVIDEAPDHGISLKKLNLRLLTAAEPYTENFRNYLAKKAGVRNLYRDTMSVYGSADIGSMASEAPLAILLRRLALRNKELFHGMFGSIAKVPTLAQYNPLFTSFEAPDGKLLLTGDNALPLVRYDIGDRGGVLNFADVLRMLRERGIDLIKEIKKAGIVGCISELPFVYVYERSDFAVKLHLHDIYPEIIRDALLAPNVRHALTGKFRMAAKYDSRQDQYLELNLELRRGKKADRIFEKTVLENVLAALERKASGPGNIKDLIKKPNLVQIIFWAAEHPLYFKPGVKQRWVETGFAVQISAKPSRA